MRRGKERNEEIDRWRGEKGIAYTVSRGEGGQKGGEDLSAKRSSIRGPGLERVSGSHSSLRALSPRGRIACPASGCLASSSKRREFVGRVI